MSSHVKFVLRWLNSPSDHFALIQLMSTISIIYKMEYFSAMNQFLKGFHYYYYAFFTAGFCWLWESLSMHFILYWLEARFIKANVIWRNQVRFNPLEGFCIELVLWGTTFFGHIGYQRLSYYYYSKLSTFSWFLECIVWNWTKFIFC